MKNSNFLSKEFICKNDTAIITNMVNFIKNIEDKVEIGYAIDKKVNAKSLLKVMTLLSNNKKNITIYCYGDKKEHNLKMIEDFLYKNNFCYSKNIENDNELNEIKKLEKEILTLVPDNKKENIKSKIKLIKEKKDKIHIEYNKYKNIIYIKNNNKAEIFAFLENDIIPMLKKLDLFYETNIINHNYIQNLKEHLIDYFNSYHITYFYKDIFYNNMQIYFIELFNKMYIKKIIDEDYTKESEYNTEYIKNIVKESIKTLEYILKNKREMSYNIPDSYFNNFKSDAVKSCIIAIINNLALIYEIDDKLINDDLISFSSKISCFIGENLLSGMKSNYKILINNIIIFFQKQFEYAYISNIIGTESPIIEYDFNYIKKFI